MSNYIINGGSHSIPHDIETLEAHGGVYYIRGNIGKLTQHGGVIYDQRPSNRVAFQTERMSDKERKKYESKIDMLEIKLANNQHEVLQLREKIRELQANEEEQMPSDDVLVRRIISLQRELEEEKAAHRKDVEDLNTRLNSVLEATNSYNRDYNADIEYQQRANTNDEMFDVFFTFINLYPFTTDGDLAHEYGISPQQVKYIAKLLNMTKSKEARQEAREYLQKQNLELIERRGGEQGNHFMKTVEQVAKNGRVINTFISAVDAMDATGYDQTTIRTHCQRYNNRKLRRYTKEGFTFRYKV